MEQCSETSAYKIQTPRNYPEENLQTVHNFLISNFRRIPYVVSFLLGNSPASEFYMPTFRNTVCSIFIGRQFYNYLPMKMEQCSETSAYNIQTPRNYPEENLQTVHNFLISNFRRILYVVSFLLGNSPASECYMLTFRNTVPSS